MPLFSASINVSLSTSINPPITFQAAPLCPSKLCNSVLYLICPSLPDVLLPYAL